MALQAIKEVRFSGSLCRLSPPNSPSKRSAPSSRGGSKLLAALDAMAAPERSAGTLAHTGAHKKLLDAPAPAHPYFSGKGRHGLKPASDFPSRPKRPSKPNKGPVVSTISGAISELLVEHNSKVHAKSKDAMLPLYSYKTYIPEPVVVYTRHEEEADELVQVLKSPLGFDMEWRVMWGQNKHTMQRRTALVQLSDERMILLIQVSAMQRKSVALPFEHVWIFLYRVPAKTQDDGEKLFRDYGILAANLVELGAFAHCADPIFKSMYNRNVVSLARMVEHYTETTLDKGEVRISNWENAPLSEEQITCTLPTPVLCYVNAHHKATMADSANDAHCAFVVYRRLREIADKHGRTLTPETYACRISGIRPAKPASTAAAPGSGSAVSKTSSMASATPTALSSHQNGPHAGPSWGRSVAYATGIDNVPAPPRPQHLRAYNLWHHYELPLHEICELLRSKENPLARSTVISYVVWALRADPALPFSMERLKALVQEETGSWTRHKDWMLRVGSHS
ncbi:uncharacterized protein FIBRA_07625 [Fibroporia radiculosa]|uniref:3'-5' exonuclease domain-containing protein n=1 Tax=Fibroporia radiculosa TaxID=599839 RepID=J4GF51_9APHY|nr:uncharacterized protein FIBRA_07625 [Fibroporia radiculosa]CCM05408.1 predicted protein [Fibroporia radiculosa]